MITGWFLSRVHARFDYDRRPRENSPVAGSRASRQCPCGRRPAVSRVAAIASAGRAERRGEREWLRRVCGLRRCANRGRDGPDSRRYSRCADSASEMRCSTRHARRRVRRRLRCLDCGHPSRRLRLVLDDEVLLHRRSSTPVARAPDRGERADRDRIRLMRARLAGLDPACRCDLVGASPRATVGRWRHARASWHLDPPLRWLSLV
jgi:hypothetical protein